MSFRQQQQAFSQGLFAPYAHYCTLTYCNPSYSRNKHLLLFSDHNAVVTGNDCQPEITKHLSLLAGSTSNLFQALSLLQIRQKCPTYPEKSKKVFSFDRTSATAQIFCVNCKFLSSFTKAVNFLLNVTYSQDFCYLLEYVVIY